MDEATLLGHLDCVTKSGDDLITYATLSLTGGGNLYFRLACYVNPPPFPPTRPRIIIYTLPKFPKHIIQFVVISFPSTRPRITISTLPKFPKHIIQFVVISFPSTRPRITPRPRGARRPEPPPPRGLGRGESQGHPGWSSSLPAIPRSIPWGGRLGARDDANDRCGVVVWSCFGPTNFAK